MWTEITRPKYERDLLRYASDLTDGEWKVLEPLLPRAKALGRPRTTALREVVNAILGERLSMAHAAPGLPATLDGAALLLSLAGRRHLGRGQPATAGRGARGRGPRGRPVGRYHRQSERKNHGKRRYPGLRRRKESQGPQASHPHRHRRPAGRGRGPRRRDPGPRRRAGGVRRHPPPLPACATMPTAPMPGPSSRAPEADRPLTLEIETVPRA